MHDELKCDFLLKQLKDELSAQANIFDQIDSKTGVALGFTFVVVGQVLASVFRMATDQNRFHTLHICAVTALFVSANLSVLLAIACGVKSRWPRVFHHALELSDDDLNGTSEEIKNKAYLALVRITKTNNDVNLDKGNWAKATYAFVALALILYLLLTVLLYVFAVPK